MNEEKILVKSEFDSSACHKFALIWYIAFFIYGFVMGWSMSELDAGVGFLAGFLSALCVGGLIHSIIYFTARNNEITLTNYKITGTYNRRLSLNIPIDSVSSVSKGWMGSLCITCAGNKYNIYYVSNRDIFCSKLNELLNTRTQQALKGVSTVDNQYSIYDEIAKLKQLLDNRIITQEEFDAKKKQLLGL